MVIMNSVPKLKMQRKNTFIEYQTCRDMIKKNEKL